MNYYVIVITLLILRLGKLYYEWKSYIIPETIHLGTVQNVLLNTNADHNRFDPEPSGSGQSVDQQKLIN